MGSAGGRGGQVGEGEERWTVQKGEERWAVREGEEGK